MNETLPGRSAGTSFYKSGGTLSPDEPSYVARSADTELHDRLSEGQFCYVLTSRQMGKSSLMNRVATKLHREGTVVAEIDLTTIGQNLTIEQWYDGLIYEIGRRANVKAQLRASWQANAQLGPLQRFITTLRDGLLTTYFQPVVIFVDEIEVVRSLPFSTDEFFAAIRECYNRRASDPEMRRLTFCLLGMATPPDLIQDPRITPFNIGKRIELIDFTFAEARPLAAGMCDGGRDGERLLQRVLYWTSGQPYLTQRLCQAVAEDTSVTGDAGVDALCRKLFLSEQARESEPNLVPLREYVLRSAPDRAAVLDLYKKIRDGKRMPADAADVNVSILQLAGIARAHGGRLVVKNRIYRAVFDRRWIRANMPDAELRRQRAAFVSAFARAAVIFGSISIAAIVFAVIAYKNYRTAESLRHQKSDELYVADINLAEQALNRHEIAPAEDLLREHIGDPMIGFEYGYLWRECDRAYYTSPNAGNFMTGVSFSPDGKYVACASVYGGVQVIDIESRSVVQTLTTGRTGYAAVEFFSKGRFLAVVDQNAVDIWDVHTWRIVRRITPETRSESNITYIAVDKAGKRLAITTNESRVFVCDLSTGRVVSQEHPAERLVLALAFSPADGLLATAGSAGIIRLWDPSTGRPVKGVNGHIGTIRALAFDQSGSRLAASGEGRMLGIWRTRGWQPESTVSTGDEIIYGLAFVPSTGQLASAGTDDVVELWNPVNHTIDREFNGHSQQIRAIASSPDGRFLASASWDGTARIWDLRREKKVKIPDPLFGNKYLTLSRDGSHVSGELPHNEVGTWNAVTGEEEARFPISTGIVALSLSSRYDDIAIAGTQEVTVRDWHTGRILWSFKIPDPRTIINRIALSPDGRSVAIGGQGGELEVWRAPGELTDRLWTNRSAATITALAWSDDGRQLATGENGSSSVKVYELGSNAKPVELQGHHADVSSLAFYPSSHEIASCSPDATLKFWNLETAREVLTISTGQTQPYSIAFSGDARRISLVAGDGTISSWESASAAEVSAALAQNQSQSTSR